MMGDHFPLLEAATQVTAAAQAYRPKDMWQVADDLDQAPEIPLHLAEALRAYTENLQATYPINPAVIEALGRAYIALGQVASSIQEIPDLFRQVHADDIRRRTAPRTGEDKWNTSGASPQVATPSTSEASVSENPYDVEAAALRDSFNEGPCTVCHLGVEDHTFMPDDDGHAHAWCNRADGEVPNSNAQAPPTSTNAPAASLTPEQVQARIRAVYASLASRPGAWVTHTDIRRELTDMPAEVLDAAFARLSNAKDVDMMGEANQKILTAEDRRNAVRYGGQNAHWIAIGI